jgi:hypothetical protein
MDEAHGIELKCIESSGSKPRRYHFEGLCVG